MQRAIRFAWLRPRGEPKRRCVRPAALPQGSRAMSASKFCVRRALIVVSSYCWACHAPHSTRPPAAIPLSPGECCRLSRKAWHYRNIPRSSYHRRFSDDQTHCIDANTLVRTCVIRMDRCFTGQIGSAWKILSCAFPIAALIAKILYCSRQPRTQRSCAMGACGYLPVPMGGILMAKFSSRQCSSSVYKVDEECPRKNVVHQL